MNTNRPKIDLFQVNNTLRYALLNLDEFALSFNLSDKRAIEKQGALYVVRRVLEDEGVEILYQKSGKPYLNQAGKISISHSYNKLAVLFSTHKDVGIDLEIVRDKILKIKQKFLSNTELNDLKGASIEKHTVYWCAKEALYKASGIIGLAFAEQLLIEPFVFLREGGKINASVYHPNSEKKHTLHYQVLDDYILVYTYRALE